MDGFKKRLNESVRFRLAFTLSLTIAALALIAGIFSFISALDEAHELQDDILRQVAQLMDGQAPAVYSSLSAHRTLGGDEETRVIVQRLGETAPVSAGVDEGGPLPLPVTLADGLHTLPFHGETFRILVKTTTSGERIAVAQESGFRNEIARDSALRTIMPLLILVPLLIIIVTWLVSAMFRPLAVLSREIDQRSEQDLHAVSIRHFPSEVRPFAIAINRLLARVAQSVEGQRRFVADAAHELRSPLTALSLQAERLAEAEMPAPARDRLATLRQGIERARKLLDQLLALARAQSDTAQVNAPVSVPHVYRRVLEDLMPLAEARHIDIGIEGEQELLLAVSELDLIAMVRNLVDNAIRYTPEGGRVDLSASVTERQIVLCVQDNGPGIAITERERVFDPFYRTLGSGESGSGLGLSIVRTIAQRIGAQVNLDFTDVATQSGLRVEIRIPRFDKVSS